MRHSALNAFHVVVYLAAATVPARAEMASVQYGGEIDLAPFQCSNISQASRISRVCYDQVNKYLLVRVDKTYRQFCDLEASTASRFLASPAMDRFFTSIIEDRHGCRPGNMPKYDQAPQPPIALVAPLGRSEAGN
jgi:hypothetical protein